MVTSCRTRPLENGQLQLCGTRVTLRPIQQALPFGEDISLYLNRCPHQSTNLLQKVVQQILVLLRKSILLQSEN